MPRGVLDHKVKVVPRDQRAQLDLRDLRVYPDQQGLRVPPARLGPRVYLAQPVQPALKGYRALPEVLDLSV